MADSYKDIIITPNRSNTADPKIDLRGGNSSVNTAITVTVYPDSNGTLSFDGSAGQLFSITNDLSGLLWSVNDVSGIPSAEVYANGSVRLAEFSGNVSIGTATNSSKLFVNGNTTVNGAVISLGDMRAPIFYDSANSSFYLDPASTGTSLFVRGEIQNPSVWINDGDNFNNYNENIRLFDAPNGVSVIAFSASGTGGTPTTSILGFGSYMERRFQTGWQDRMYNGYVEASGSYRAPIFYDSANTSFYVDPASTSNLNGLTVVSTITGSITGNAGTATTLQTARTITVGSTGRSFNGSADISWSLSDIGAAATSHTHSISAITDAARWWNNFGDNHPTRTSFDATTPSIGFGWRYIQGNTNGPGVNGAGQYYSVYVGLGNDYGSTGSGSYGMQIAYPRNVTTPYITIRYNEANSLGAWQKISAGYADSAGAVDFNNLTNKGSGTGTYTTSGDFRAPIFYDSNDTSYYVDANGTSVLNSVNTWGEIGPRRNDSGTLLRSYNTSASSALQFYLDHSGGNVNIGNNRGVVFGGGSYWEIANSVRSPIFYDSNNTSYLVDAASSSFLNVLGLNSTLDVYGQTYIRSHLNILNTAGNGWNTVIDRNGGDNWIVYGGNSVRAPIFYNKNDTNVRWEAGTFVLRSSSPTVFFRDTDHNSAMIHVNSNLFYILRGGNDTESWNAVGSGSWPLQINLTNNDAQFGGNVTAIYDMYAQGYYDRDNTAYLLNPASTSTINEISMFGLLTGRSSGSTDVNSANDTGSFSARGNTSTVACMSFHRTGAYAMNMGLGTDNVFRIGGWSASNNAFQMDGSGNLTMLNNVTAYSDARLKKDIVKIDNAIDKVQQLNGYTYTRTDTGSRQAGVIAQEVMKVLPEVVMGSEETNYSVAYGNMVGLLVEAIKEQQEHINRLEVKINSLQQGN